MLVEGIPDGGGIGPIERPTSLVVGGIVTAASVRGGSR